MCSNTKIKQIQVDNWGADIPARWGHIKPFSVDEPVKFVAIGPKSEVDAVLIMDTSEVGTQVVSVASPLVMDIDRDIVVRPLRSFGNTSGEQPFARLELLAYNHVPVHFGDFRAPRVYPLMQSAILSSATDTAINLATAYDASGSVAARQANLPVMGAKQFTIYIKNQSLADVSWNLIHSRDGNDLFPITPSTWTPGTPTYNTILSGHNEAYHLDVQVDAIEHVYMVAKVTVAGSHRISVGCEVRDR